MIAQDLDRRQAANLCLARCNHFLLSLFCQTLLCRQWHKKSLSFPGDFEKLSDRDEVL